MGVEGRLEKVGEVLDCGLCVKRGRRREPRGLGRERRYGRGGGRGKET